MKVWISTTLEGEAFLSREDPGERPDTHTVEVEVPEPIVMEWERATYAYERAQFELLAAFAKGIVADMRKGG